MPDVPKRADQYDAQTLELARGGLLHLATVLGDHLDEVMVIGGLVPSLIAPPPPDDPHAEPHLGTRDVDVALALSILDDDRYHAIAERLRAAGFAPDVNENGNPTFQRWVLDAAANVTVDFLIPTTTDTEPGKVKKLDPTLGAVATRGLADAFRTRVPVILSGRTLANETTERTVFVCGPAGFVVLKALALRNRGDAKDAYDLYYVLKHHPDRPEGIAAALARLGAGTLHEPDALEDALTFLAEDFATIDHIGAARAGAFLGNTPDPAVAADVVAHVGALLRAMG